MTLGVCLSTRTMDDMTISYGVEALTIQNDSQHSNLISRYSRDSFAHENLHGPQESSLAS